MMTRLRAAAVVAGCLFASAVAAKSDPKPLEVEKSLKPPAGESYFDDVFALNTNAKQLGALRTDGATFAKLDFIDVATAKVTKSFDLPSKTLAADRIELLPDGKGGRKEYAIQQMHSLRISKASRVRFTRLLSGAPEPRR